MIRLVLADDQALLRQGLRGLLDLHPEFEVVGEAGDGEEAEALARELQPDVLILDVRMPKLSGLHVLERLGRDDALAPTIMLTTFDDDAAFIAAAAAGAKAFMLKDVSLEILHDTIVRVSNGESVLGPAVDERVIRGLKALGGASLGGPLPQRPTRRETEVLRLMAGGFTNREIAKALGTQPGTIKNHASSVFMKLGVRDRTQAVLYALKLGWI